ncbi:hypothetical protein KKA89_00585 [Patescibacteria group bacterium]|nr:hypothetical protein [Patescibacteria group bacterium]MBU2416477.1 hypothetical protein [Patescibacteria group bacterium]
MDQDDKNNEGIDLSGSLKDSDTGVKFEEYRAPRSYYPGTPKIVQLVIKYSGGAIKDEEQANYVLIGFVVVAIIFSLFLFFGGGSSAYNEKIIPPIPAAGVGDPNFRP